jgi:hypothetical protein
VVVVVVFVAEGRMVANEGGGVDDDQNGREEKRSESRENGGSNTGPERWDGWTMMMMGWDGFLFSTVSVAGAFISSKATGSRRDWSRGFPVPFDPRDFVHRVGFLCAFVQEDLQPPVSEKGLAHVMYSVQFTHPIFNQVLYC